MGLGRLYAMYPPGPHRLGRAMLERLKALCADRGYGEMWVLTNGSNAPAMRLYASAGGQREFDDVEMFAFPTRGDGETG